MEILLDFILKKEVYLPVVYVAIGIIIYIISKAIINRLFHIRFTHHASQKRTKTIKVLLQNIIKYTISIFVVLAILTVYHIDVKTILTGLGIVGLVFGLALQDIIKDFLSGVSIILENQYALGDTIEVNGFKGEVIFLGLKTTRIKNYDGDIMILSNRNIDHVINYSAANSLAIVDVSVAYDSDITKVEAVLNELAKKLSTELKSIKGDVQVLGINELADSAIIYRLIVPTEAMKHFEVQREIRKQIKIIFDKEKIEIPFPQIEVHHGK